MGCVNANIGNKGGCLTATVGRVGSNLKAAISLSDETLVAAISRISQGLEATIGIVCTPNTDVYIRVNPKTLWFFTEHEVLDVDVMSNIKWIVK